MSHTRQPKRTVHSVDCNFPALFSRPNTAPYPFSAFDRFRDVGNGLHVRTPGGLLPDGSIARMAGFLLKVAGAKDLFRVALLQEGASLRRRTYLSKEIFRTEGWQM